LHAVAVEKPNRNFDKQKVQKKYTRKRRMMQFCVQTNEEKAVDNSKHFLSSFFFEAKNYYIRFSPPPQKVFSFSPELRRCVPWSSQILRSWIKRKRYVTSQSHLGPQRAATILTKAGRWEEVVQTALPYVRDDVRNSKGKRAQQEEVGLSLVGPVRCAFLEEEPGLWWRTSRP